MERNKQTPSAGAFVFRNGEKEQEILMIRTKKGYGFPKGHVEPGESLTETAIREVEEETGIRIQITDERKWETTSGFPDENRTITYFLAAPCGGSLSPQLSEVKDALWIPVSEAAELLHFQEDRTVFEKVLTELAV